MALFNFTKKKPLPENPNAYIKILGSGCHRCMEMETNTRLALKELNRNDEVSHISDVDIIANYGVVSTPGLVIGEEVVSSGAILSVKAIKEILRDK